LRYSTRCVGSSRPERARTRKAHTKEGTKGRTKMFLTCSCLFLVPVAPAQSARACCVENGQGRSLSRVPIPASLLAPHVVYLQQHFAWESLKKILCDMGIASGGRTFGWPGGWSNFTTFLIWQPRPCPFEQREQHGKLHSTR
jgi:hypothetical protein